MTVSDAPSRSVDQLSFAVSALLSPLLIYPLFLAAIAWHETASVRDFGQWVALALLFSAVLPFLFVIWRVRMGAISDLHVMRREDRNQVFTVMLISIGIGICAFWLLDAPRLFIVLAMLAFFNTILAAAITLFWKISLHTWVLAAAITAYAILVDQPRIWWLLLLVPLVMWARVQRGRHTLAQVAGGAILGIVLTAILSMMIR